MVGFDDWQTMTKWVVTGDLTPSLDCWGISMIFFLYVVSVLWLACPPQPTRRTGHRKLRPELWRDAAVVADISVDSMRTSQMDEPGHSDPSSLASTELASAVVVFSATLFIQEAWTPLRKRQSAALLTV